MKLKTNQSLAKRIKASGGKKAKLLRVKAAKSHLLSHKSDRTKISLEIHSVDAKRVRKMLPYL
ncbi:MAG: 50S ribosomal protein L35 [bacterium]